MKIKYIVAIVYAFVAIGFACYGALWGGAAYKSFAYHLGRGIVWPVLIFPGLGQLIGGLVIVGVIALLVASKR